MLTVTVNNGFKEPEDTVKEIFDMAYDNNPENLQKALKALHQYDTNPIKAMIVVIWKFKIGLSEAKFMVMDSDAWNPK